MCLSVANTIAILYRTDGTCFFVSATRNNQDFRTIDSGEPSTKSISRACGALQLSSSLVPHSSPSYNLSTPQELHDWQYRLPRFTPSRTSLQSDRETSHLLLKRGGWFAGKSCQLFPMDCRSGRAMPIFVSCMDVAVDVEVLTPGIDCWVTRCTCTSQRFFA